MNLRGMKENGLIWGDEEGTWYVKVNGEMKRLYVMGREFRNGEYKVIFGYE